MNGSHGQHAELAVFAGSASRRFAQAICQHLGIALGRGETLRFSDDNLFVRVLENVRGRDAYIVQTLSPPVNDHFVELLFWIDAFKRASAAQVTAVVPFFSYAKGDKKDEPRVSIRARVCADCLESAGVDRMLTMDLHAPQIQGFFRVPVDHLYAMPVMIEKIREHGHHDWVVVAPDAGFIGPARRYARLLNAPLAIAEKRRAAHDEKPTVDWLIGPVKGKRALIVDDFVTSGGTLSAVTERLVAEGVTEVHAAVCHGVLGEAKRQWLDQSGLRDLLITDTIEHDPGQLPEKVRVVSVAPVFAEAIRSIHRQTSVSRLFPEQAHPAAEPDRR